MRKSPIWLASSFFLATSARVVTSASAEDLFWVRARPSSKCISVFEARYDNGATMNQWDCLNQPNVKLRKVPKGGGAFTLQFTHSDKCAQVNGASRDNDVPITQWECNPTPRHMLWREERAQDDFVFIRNVETGKCMHVRGGTLENGLLITQWDCGPANTQWKIEPAPRTP
jgi:hypothetical protein